MTFFPEPVPGATRAAIAAGALFLNSQDHIMLVRPTYKEYWDIPGGYVEPGESPHAACTREVEEELGLHIAVGDLLVVDWAPHPTDGDKFLFIFAGPRLTDTDHGTLRLQESELTAYRYVPVDALTDFTVSRLANRLRHAHDAYRHRRTLYLEHGSPAVNS